MTDHDQNAAIGDLTKRYSGAKRKRAALVSEIGNRRQMLAVFATALQQRAEGVYPHNVSAATIPDVPKQFPTPDELTALLNDLRATLTEIERTQHLLSEAGLDVS